MARTITVTFALPEAPEGLDEHARAIYGLAASLPGEVDLRDAPPGYALGLLAQVALWTSVAKGERPGA